MFAAGSRGYSSDQIALFDDVLQELAVDIEVKARARLARRLAHIERAPPKLIRSLAFDDEIAVAEPLLLHSPRSAMPIWSRTPPPRARSIFLP